MTWLILLHDWYEGGTFLHDEAYTDAGIARIQALKLLNERFTSRNVRAFVVQGYEVTR